MSALFFAFPENEEVTLALSGRLAGEMGQLELREFPDGETYVRVRTPEEKLRGCDAVIVCSLDRADLKFLPIHFLAATLREMGAIRVGLVAPYLGYMRQDTRFHPGEAVTSRAFAKALSASVDWLVTMDPHLHRHKSMREIYSIPAAVAHAAPAIARWIGPQVPSPVLVGPDGESSQWVKALAMETGAPYVVARKERRGDRDVEVSVPDIESWQKCTPVVLDDIISTGQTMIETVRHLRATGMAAPVCVAVHAVFADKAFEELRAAGAGRIATCNTISHISNEIDITAILADAVAGMLHEAAPLPDV